MKRHLKIFFTYMLVTITGVLVVSYFNDDISHKHKATKDITGQTELEESIAQNDDAAAADVLSFSDACSTFVWNTYGFVTIETSQQLPASRLFPHIPLFKAIRQLLI